MDVVVELAKSAFTLVGLFLVLIAVPILFMFIFGIATGIDDRMNR
jgi:hypothetical protein